MFPTKGRRAAKSGDSYPQASDSVGIRRQLARLGLVEKEIAGDGNCLFRSLADQLLGDCSRHAEIRAKVCHHLGQFSEEYKFFCAEEEEGSLDKHIQRMKQNSVYGGNMELVAASRVFEADIHVHQSNNPIWTIRNPGGTAQAQAHILYHSWEHYSSIRNSSGPFEGLPEIKIAESSAAICRNDDDDDDDMEAPSKHERIVMEQCQIDDWKIARKALKAAGGNIDRAVTSIWEDRNEETEDNETLEETDEKKGELALEDKDENTGKDTEESTGKLALEDTEASTGKVALKDTDESTGKVALEDTEETKEGNEDEKTRKTEGGRTVQNTRRPNERQKKRQRKEAKRLERRGSAKRESESSTNRVTSDMKNIYI
ncbi:MAG: hypothetical protein SGCHY_003661 [Lobulomycetales sp.]